MYKINGKEYATLEDIPQEYRDMLEDKNNNNIPDFVEESLDVELPAILSAPAKRIVQHMFKDQAKQVVLDNNQDLKERYDEFKQQEAELKSSNVWRVLVVIATIIALVIYFKRF